MGEVYVYTLLNEQCLFIKIRLQTPAHGRTRIPLDSQSANYVYLFFLLVYWQSKQGQFALNKNGIVSHSFKSI